MAHRLDKICIRNFRSCTNVEFALADMTPLVGYNNAGKSNVLTALRWFVRPFTLSATDFAKSDVQLQVEATVAGVSTDLLQNLGEHRERIEPFVVNELIRLRRTQAAPNVKLKDIQLEILDPGSGQWKVNPTGIPNALNALLPEPISIGAMEDAVEDASKMKQGTTIGRLLAELVTPIERQYGAQFEESLTAIRHSIGADGNNRAPELTAFDTDVSAKLADFFPGISIRVDLPTPEIREVFKAGTIRVYEVGDNTGRAISSYGHGTQRAIQMALVRHLADATRLQGNQGRTLVLIEEPELYLHPQAIEQLRAALKRLSEQGYQVVYSTHSPQMISVDDIPDALILRRSAALGTHKRMQIRQAVLQTVNDNVHQAEILFSLQHAGQILFSEKVLIAEGKTERLVLPFLFEHITRRTMGQSRIALVELGGVDNVPKTLQILQALDLPTKAVVDLDFAFRGALAGGLLQQTDPDVATCKQYFQASAQNLGISLDGQGLPRGGPAMRADQAYGILSAPGAVPHAVESIFQKLLMQGVWCWKRGAIEEPLGLQNKGDSANLSALNHSITGHGLDNSVADPATILGFIGWLQT